MGKPNLKAVLIQTGFNIERMKEDRAINEKAYLVLKTRNEIALVELEACDGKADQTSEKDLRVCEVIASASFIVQKGVDAMYDELIDKHLNILRQQPFTSSVQHFVETGKVSGTFLLQLRKLLKEHDEICQAAK